MKPLKIVAVLLCIISTPVLTACSSSSDSHNTEDSIINSEGETMLTKELSEKQSDELLASSEYFPIGTVVTVGDELKKMMIVGLLQVKAENNEIYDYSAVLYPEGYVGPSETYLFNKEQISKVYHLGYVSQEQKDNNKRLEELSSSIENK